MVKKLYKYCSYKFKMNNPSGDPLDLINCCVEAGVDELWNSLLNCTRSIQSKTGPKKERALLLLGALLSSICNRSYKFLPDTQALVRLGSTNQVVGQLINKVGLAPSPRTMQRRVNLVVEDHPKSILNWIREDSLTSLVLVIDDFSRVMISRLPSEFRLSVAQHNTTILLNRGSRSCLVREHPTHPVMEKEVINECTLEFELKGVCEFKFSCENTYSHCCNELERKMIRIGK